MNLEQGMEFGHDDRERIYNYVERHGECGFDDIEDGLRLDPRASATTSPSCDATATSPSTTAASPSPSTTSPPRSTATATWSSSCGPPTSRT